MTQISPEVFIADSQDPSTLCGGDKSFQDCGTAQTLMEEFGAAQPAEEQVDDSESGLLTYISKMIYLPLGCVACRKICEIAVSVRDGSPTGAGILKGAPQEIYFKMPAQRFVWKKTTDAIRHSLEPKTDIFISAEENDKNTTPDSAGV